MCDTRARKDLAIALRDAAEIAVSYRASRNRMAVHLAEFLLAQGAQLPRSFAVFANERRQLASSSLPALSLMTTSSQDSALPS